MLKDLFQIETKLQQLLEGKVTTNQPLKEHTAMKVGGPALFFYRALNSRQLCQAVQAALKIKIPFFLLGNGGNVIFSDKGFEGLVILNQATSMAIFEDKAQIMAESGISNSQLVSKAASAGLGGIEFLATIPGTIGGAIYGNAGAYGWEINSFIDNLSLLEMDMKNRKVRVVIKPRSFLSSKYRSTILKRQQHQLINKKRGLSTANFHPIILSATFQLQRKKKEAIISQIAHFIKIRQERQPQNIHSSGSIFKNPLGRSSKIQEDQKAIEKTASFMLDSINAKKMRVNDARVSPKHANFVFNAGGATSQDIKDLVDQLHQKVLERFEVDLEPEIEFVGKFR